MKSMKCIPQRFFKIMLGVVLLTGALGFIAIGFTLLPYIGFIVAIPFVVLAFYIMTAKLNDRCEIDFSDH